MNDAVGGLRSRGRTILTWSSVALILGASATAIPFTPVGASTYLSIAFVATIAFTIQCAVSEPKDLLIAVLLALAPIVALVGPGSPTWMVGPLATLVLVGAELNALAWASQGSDQLDQVRERRLRDILMLGALAATGSLAVTVLSLSFTSGAAWAWFAAMGSLGAIGALLFRRVDT